MILYAQIRRYSGSAVLPAGPLSASAVSFFAFRIRAERKCMKIRSELEQAFAADCTVIRMAKEYAGYFDDIKCVILTDLSETQIREKYTGLLAQYSPFVIAPPTLKAAIADYHCNENKHTKRMVRNTGFFPIDEDAERIHPELVGPSVEELFFHNVTTQDLQISVRKALSKLPEVQRRRLVKHSFLKKTWKEISIEERCSERAVGYSIKAAEKNFLAIWEKDFPQYISMLNRSEVIMLNRASLPLPVQAEKEV